MRSLCLPSRYLPSSSCVASHCTEYGLPIRERSGTFNNGSYQYRYSVIVKNDSDDAKTGASGLSQS